MKLPPFEKRDRASDEVGQAKKRLRVRIKHEVDSIRPAQWDRKAFALELTEARSVMPMSAPVIGDMRSGARY